MDTQFCHRYTDVLCSIMHGHNLQVVLRRARPMSAQLQILVLDRTTHTVRNTIHTMMFEGVSKDDVNYRMLVHYEKGKANKLLLFYPNGIVCVYQNILQQVQTRKKVQLAEVLQCDYDTLLAPQILNDRLVAVSRPSGNKGREREQAQGMVLVSMPMEKFEREVEQRRTMSSPDVNIVRVQEILAPAEKQKGVLKVDGSQLKLSDMCCCRLQEDILCFLSFNTGLIMRYSFSNVNQANQVFSMYDRFHNTDIFEQALAEADLDLPEVLTSNQLRSANSQESQQALKLCKVTCLDFLPQPHKNTLGLLLAGDQLGFVYIVQVAASSRSSDTLLYMSNANQQSHQEAKAIIACKWISSQDTKFAIMTGDGDLKISEVIVNREEALCDTAIVNKIHQIQTFEELPQSFMFSDINQIGNQAIQAFAETELRPGFLPDTISILWPNRVLRKHDLSLTNRRAGNESAMAQNQAKDKIITQSSLHHFTILANLHPLKINGAIGASENRNVISCSSLSSNGSCFMNSLKLEQMVPSSQNEHLSCPAEYEHVFYIDDRNTEICTFSNLTGNQKSLFSFAPYLSKKASGMVVFTDLQMRHCFAKGIAKFMISWIDPQAVSHDKKHQFTWVAFDFRNDKIVEELSNQGPPKFGVYPTFLTGTPLVTVSESGQPESHFDNLDEAIVCLLQDVSSSSHSQTSKLRIFQFDPFIDTRDVSLNARVQHMYATPLRNGKAIMYYNVTENILQFSKNKSESKYSEDDFGLYSNRKYSFQLAYDERVLDVKWYNMHGGRSPSRASAAQQSSSLRPPLDQPLDQAKSNPKAVIATNQRIYIVDKNLGILQNFSLVQHQSRLKLRSLTVLSQTILFSTDTHLHYLTQEKGSMSTSPSGILLSFNASMQNQRPCLIGALSDRILLAYTDSSQKSNVRFAIKAVSMLEPLLLGYLSSLSQSKIQQEIDKDLIQRACVYLDSNQVSTNLLAKLSAVGLSQELTFCASNPSSLQFGIQEQMAFLPDQSNTSFLARLFPNKQIAIQTEEAEFNPGQLEDRNDMILKMQMDPSYCFEKQVIESLLQKLKTKDKIDDVGRSLDLCEMTQDWQFALNILNFYGKLNYFIKVLKDNNQQDKFTHLIKYATHVQQANGRKLVMGITPSRYQTWLRQEWSAFQNEPDAHGSLKKTFNKLMRIKLAYNECLYGWQVDGKPMFEVVSDNMANWFGYDSIIASEQQVDNVQKKVQAMQEAAEAAGEDPSNEREADIITDETSPEDIEEAKHVQLYLRCDEGQGSTLNDVTDNKFVISLESDQVWSQEALNEGEPIEYGDKWGKTNQPSYSVYISDIGSVPAPEALKMLIKSNFTFEFWLKNEDQGEIVLLNNYRIDFRGQLLTVGQDKLKLDLGSINLSKWIHIALVHSSARGCCLYVNAVPVCERQILTKFQPIQSSLIETLDRSAMIDVTELRLWDIALNEAIIKENYTMPLSMLAEQKRKIKVNINKKKQQKPKGLGLPSLKQKFQTHLNVKPVPEEPNQPEPTFQTNIVPPAPSNDFQQDFNHRGSKLGPEQGFDSDFKLEPEFKLNSQPPKQEDQNNFFDFSVEPVKQGEVQSPAMQIAESPIRAPPAEQELDRRLSKSVFGANKRQSTKKSLEQRSPEALQNSVVVQRQQTELMLGTLQTRQECMEKLNGLLCESILMILQVYDNEKTSLESRFTALISHLEYCHKKAGYLTLDQFQQILQIVSGLKLVSRVQEEIKQLTTSVDDKVLIASLSTLMLSCVGHLGVLARSSEPVGFLASQLQSKIMTLSLVSNVNCNQNATVERILSLRSEVEFIPPDLIEFCEGILEAEKLATYGPAVNHREIGAAKCPQCQSHLQLGHLQRQCFDCYAQLVVCHATLQIILDEQGSFATQCHLCKAQYDNQWLSTMRVAGSNAVKCPCCQIANIIN